MYINRSLAKYGNSKTVYNGVRYDSKLEARLAQEIDLEIKAGVYTDVDRQVRIKLYAYIPNGEKVYLFNYIADFVCKRPDGSFVIKEAKGMVTDTYRMKRKILDAIWLPDHPDYSFEEVKDGRRHNQKNR